MRIADLASPERVTLPFIKVSVSRCVHSGYSLALDGSLLRARYVKLSCDELALDAMFVQALLQRLQGCLVIRTTSADAVL